MRLLLAATLLSASCATTLGKAQAPRPPVVAQQLAFSSYDACTQGPLQTEIVVGNEPGATLSLGFWQGTLPMELMYRVEVAQSGRAIASGTLVQEGKTEVGMPAPKNPCVGRQNPSRAAGGDGFAGEPTDDSALVVTSGALPGIQYLYDGAKLPEEAPLDELELRGFAPGTRLRVTFWSQVPYPTQQTRFQIAVTHDAPAPDKKELRVAARVERKVKRATKEFAGIVTTDAKLAARAADASGARAKDLSIERGRRIFRYHSEFEKRLYQREPKRVRGLYARLSTELAPVVRAFVSDHGAEIGAYQQDRAEQQQQRDKKRDQRRHRRNERRDERAERVAGRITERERRRYEAIKEEDTRLAARADTAQGDEKKSLDLARGEALFHYRKRYYKRRKNRDSRPERIYYKVQSSIGAEIESFLDARYTLVTAYESWKSDEKYRRDAKRDEKRRKRRQEHVTRAADRIVKRASRALKEAERRDATHQARLGAVPVDSEEYKRRRAARGRDLESFQKKGTRLLYKKNRYVHRPRDLFTKGFTFHVKDRLQREFAPAMSAFLAPRIDEITFARSWEQDRDRRDRIASAQARADRLIKRFTRRIERLTRRDERLLGRAERADTKEERISIDAKRWRKYKRLSKRYVERSGRIQRRGEYTLQGLEKVASLLSDFLFARPGLESAYYAKKSLRDQARDKRQDRRREFLGERVNARFAREARREARKLARIQAKDATLTAQKADLVTRGAPLAAYEEHLREKNERVTKRYNKRSQRYFFFLGITKEPWNKIYQEGMAFLAQRSDAVYAASTAKAREDAIDRKTRRALRQWEDFLASDKRRLTKIERATGERRAKLEYQRAQRRNEAIAALLLAYDNASPEGRAFLQEAYALATSLQGGDLAGLTPPPPPAREEPGPAPMPGATWRAGYWTLVSGTWQWKPGFWELPPGAVSPGRGGNGVLVPSGNSQ